MVFEIVLKKDIQNQISNYENTIPKTVTVTTLNITDGLLKKGNYYIPVEHILFIKEVT